jgi:hypothetical protein
MGVSDQRQALAAVYPRGQEPGTHWTGGWVGLRAGMDTEDRMREDILNRPTSYFNIYI